jgi:CheY-like chemotaxis protein
MSDILSGVEGLRFRVVTEAIEVTPSDGWDKGAAVLAILEHMEQTLATHPLAVYFGDAANDIEGMAVATQAGGVSIGIGPYAPVMVEQRLADSSALLTCLDELSSRLATQRGLPIAPRPEAPAPRPDVEGASGSAPSAEDADAGLLLLDADAVSRGELAAGLTALGWQVWQADTSERATQLLREHGEAIDVALVDLQLPGLLGARTQADLGLRRPGLIRGFLSAGVSPYTATAFGRLSSLPLFIKPLSADELNATLRAMLGRPPHSARQH